MRDALPIFLFRSSVRRLAHGAFLLRRAVRTLRAFAMICGGGQALISRVTWRVQGNLRLVLFKQLRAVCLSSVQCLLVNVRGVRFSGATLQGGAKGNQDVNDQRRRASFRVQGLFRSLNRLLLRARLRAFIGLVCRWHVGTQHVGVSFARVIVCAPKDASGSLEVRPFRHAIFVRYQPTSVAARRQGTHPRKLRRLFSLRDRFA